MGKRFVSKNNTKIKIVFNVVLVFILVMGIGFSYISTKLSIDGKIVLSRFKDFNLYVTSASDRTTFKSDTYRENIKTITLDNTSSPPNNVVDSFDVSESGNGGVMAYLVKNAVDDTKYDLYIQGNGYLYANQDSSYLFSGLTSLETINGLDKLDVSRTTNMSNMFSGCSNLSILDLSSFDLSKITNTIDIFKDDISLGQITTPKVYPTDSNISIILPGVLSDSSDNNFTTLNTSSPITTTIKKTAMFLPGNDFNVKIKVMAGNNITDNNFIDYAIKNIIRTNKLNNEVNDDNIISTSTSNYPIYAWFDSGNIYYYTEAVNPYMNVSGDFMFTRIHSVKTIDLNTIDTNKTTSMRSLFYGDNSLETLDLTSFNTSNVQLFTQMFDLNGNLTEIKGIDTFDTSSATDMRWMFANCNKLESIDVSSFDTSNVTTLTGMFSYLYSLKSLDISNFDTSKVTDMGALFYLDSALTTIYVSDKFIVNDDVIDVSINVTDERYIFKGCSSLVGGLGTIFSEDHIYKDYARIDGGEDNPGYFTRK